jgi:lipopolysaccharide/colanic/teichoic acid biosynthesis glycosyltransferase
VKRPLDFLVAVVALIVLSPVLLVTSVLVRLRLGRPVLFRQTRVGRNGVPFEIVKFRTMTDQHDDAGELLPDVGRLSSFGRFLRSTSLDELPELWNVVKGEMSLVGPRPLPARYLPRYSAEERRRHQVRPGITGWAQVNGRNALDWNDRLAADVWYVDNQSLKLDFKIIGRTLLSVVRREGVSAPGESTMYELPHHEDRVVS